jgi:hypothetical protein
MENSPEMLDYVKATFDAGRLRIIGVLARHPATVRSIADELKIPFRQAFNHIAYLEHVGVVHKEGDVFTLDETGLESLSRKQFASRREIYIPAPELDPRTRKVLSAHLNPDGSIKQIPYQSVKLRVILDYLISAFTPGVDYTERHVNDILRRFHEDTAGLRRDLVEAGLLSRVSDGSRYWRSPEPSKGKLS